MKIKYITNCVKTNPEEIYKQIQYFRTETGQQPNYLVMHEDMLELIKSEYKEAFGKLLNEPQQNSSGFVSQYCGIDIATCNRLKFGEIEVI